MKRTAFNMRLTLDQKRILDEICWQAQQTKTDLFIVAVAEYLFRNGKITEEEKKVLLNGK